ncbi:hypothetical protein, partial [Cetobacterium sp.]|uniref:hypothetical protein n=1 Tax=Cetobacterium sp. TaxID=2071632 RepID=UPI003EE57484
KNRTTFHNELGAMIGTRAIWNPMVDFSITADVVYLAQYKNVSNTGQPSGGNNSKSTGKPGSGSGGGNSGGGNGGGSGSGGGSGTGPGSGTGGGSKSIKRSVEESVIIRLGFKKYF